MKNLLKSDYVKVPLSLLCLCVFFTPIYISALDYRENFDYDLYFGENFLNKIEAKEIYKKVVEQKRRDTHLYIMENYKVNSYICIEEIKSSKNKLFNYCLEKAKVLVKDKEILTLNKL